MWEESGLPTPLHIWCMINMIWSQNSYNTPGKNKSQMTTENVGDLQVGCKMSCTEGAAIWYICGGGGQKITHEENFFFSIPEKQTFFSSKITILYRRLYKLLVRNKLFFLTKYRKQTFFSANSSGLPPLPINIKWPLPKISSISRHMSCRVKAVTISERVTIR